MDIKDYAKSLSQSNRRFRRALSLATEQRLIDNWRKTGTNVANVSSWEYCSFAQLRNHHLQISKSWKVKFTEDFINRELPSHCLKPTVFCGYAQTTSQAQVVECLNENYEPTRECGRIKFIITDKTPFFSAQGGQDHDNAIIVTQNNVTTSPDRLKIKAAQTYQQVVLHELDVSTLSEQIVLTQIKNKQTVSIVVNQKRRHQLACNHSATHLLHQAVQRLFGIEAKQKGSAIFASYFRFDFNCQRSLQSNDLKQINLLVNTQIKSKLRATVEEVSFAEIQANEQIEKHFQESYPARVRTIRFGLFSYEVCGGTHVNNTSEIECFLAIKITKKGFDLYRIVVITGWDQVYQYYVDRIKKIRQLLDKVGQDYATKVEKYKFKLLRKHKFQEQFVSMLSDDFLNQLTSAESDIEKYIRVKSKCAAKSQNILAPSQVWKKLSHQQIKWSAQISLHYLLLNSTDSSEQLNVAKLLKNTANYRHLFGQNAILLFAQPCSDKKIRVTIFTNINSNKKNIANARDLLLKLTGFFTGSGGGSRLFASGVLVRETLTHNDLINWQKTYS